MSRSPSVSATLIAYIAVWAVSAAISGALAARKNRSAFAWAVGGILFPVTALLVLLFMAYLCPKCGRPVTYDEWRLKECPRCGGVRQSSKDSGERDFMECPSCHRMIAPGDTKCPHCGWA